MGHQVIPQSCDHKADLLLAPSLNVQPQQAQEEPIFTT